MKYLSCSRRVQFDSHGYMTVPCFWMNPDVPAYNRFLPYIHYYRVAVRVSGENLKREIKIYFLIPSETESSLLKH